MGPAADPARLIADAMARAPVRSAALQAHAKTCGCGGRCAACRAAKALRPSAVPVSRPGEQAELEASRAAEAVLAAPAAGPVAPRLSALADAPVTARATAGSAAPVADAASVTAGLRARSAPLRASTRAFMQPRFGRDFAHVRLHDGPDASASARAVGALAYTVGSDIVVDSAATDIESVAGRRLLAHELAHVVQQASRRPAVRIVQRQAREGAHPGRSAPASAPDAGAAAAASSPVFTCGPDVRAQLADVVARTRAAYAGWSANQKDEACWALENSSCGPYAWDIVELHNADWIPSIYQPRGCATTGAHPACGQSVQIGSGCHHHGSANYVIFGVMARLCGMWRSTMRALIWAYKRSSANYEGSRDWALAGYDGWPAAAEPAGDRNNCRAGGCPYVGGPFTLFWYPTAPTETVTSECDTALRIHRDLRDNPPQMNVTPDY